MQFYSNSLCSVLAAGLISYTFTCCQVSVLVFVSCRIHCRSFVFVVIFLIMFIMDVLNSFLN